MKKVLVVVFLAAYGVIKTSPDNHEAELTSIELIAKWGYPAETHIIQTEDGYLLGVHRIPHGKGMTKATKPPVLLQHCLFCTSADWIYTGPEKGLAFILADAGYDVWLGNSRGNTYSHSHVSWSASDSNFWNFSWHEMGKYDLPAVIDYITEQTKEEKIYYIGHSMGSTIYFVMCSERPEYNNKFRAIFVFGPCLYVSRVKSPVFRFLADYHVLVKRIYNFFGINEMLPRGSLLSTVGKLVCHDRAITQEMCANFMFWIVGYDSPQLNRSMLPVMLGHTPAGASVKQMQHLGQIATSGKFRKFDYGPQDNMIKYGFESPPNYKINNSIVPVAVYYGENDYLAVPEDVKTSYKELVNPIGLFKVPLPEFNHLDFIWAIDARTLVYDHVMELMQKY